MFQVFLKVSHVFIVSSYILLFGSPFSSPISSIFIFIFSSTSSDSSTIEVLLVREIQSLPPVETMVRGDDSASAFDRSGSSEHSSPQGLHWVDPKVTRITSAFVKRAPVADFLDRVDVLKPDASVDVIGIKPCEVPDTVCSTRSLTKRPFFTCTLVCFLTFTSLSLLTTSRWVCFGRSTWLLLNCIIIHGRLSRPSASFAMFFACLLPLQPFLTIIPPTQPNWFCGIH